MFDYSVDKIILIRLNCDGAKVKYEEYSDSIDATLCNVDIYRKDGRQTKAVGQCTECGGGVVAKGVSAGLSAVRQQDYAVYHVAAYELHASSQSLQNSMEKTFGELGLVEDTFQKFIHTCWSSQ